MNLKSKGCIFIEHGTSEYEYRFWDPENRKVLRHNDAVFNEKKVYKDLLIEMSVPEKDLGVTPRSTSEQQSRDVDLEFVELDDVPVEKSRSILEGMRNPE